MPRIWGWKKFFPEKAKIGSMNQTAYQLGPHVFHFWLTMNLCQQLLSTYHTIVKIQLNLHKLAFSPSTVSLNFYLSYSPSFWFWKVTCPPPSSMCALDVPFYSSGVLSLSLFFLRLWTCLHLSYPQKNSSSTCLAPQAHFGFTTKPLYSTHPCPPFNLWKSGFLWYHVFPSPSSVKSLMSMI